MGVVRNKKLLQRDRLTCVISFTTLKGICVIVKRWTNWLFACNGLSSWLWIRYFSQLSSTQSRKPNRRTSCLYKKEVPICENVRAFALRSSQACCCSLFAAWMCPRRVRWFPNKGQHARMRNRADERDTPNSSTNLKLVKKRASDEIILTLEHTCQYRFSSRRREVDAHCGHRGYDS